MFNWYNLVKIMLIPLQNKKLSLLKNVQDRRMKTFLTAYITGDAEVIGQILISLFEHNN